MIKHSVKKAFLLLFIYSTIILGICFIQFRSGHIINKTLGSMRLSLKENIDPNQQSFLDNSFQLVYQGLIFENNTANPIIETFADGTKQNAELFAYKIGENEIELSFKSGSILKATEKLITNEENKENETIFELSADWSEEIFNKAKNAQTAQNSQNIQNGETENETNSISKIAKQAKQVSTISVPMRFGNGYQTSTSEKTDALLVSSKTQTFAFSEIPENNSIILSTNKMPVHYALYKPIEKTTYEILASSSLAQTEAFNDTIQQFRAGFVAANQNLGTNTSEKAVASFVAESASKGNFLNAKKTALATVGENRKTYLTTPYFGNLENTNKTLVSHNKNLHFKAKEAFTNKNLSAFDIDNLLFTLVYQNDINLAYSLFEFIANTPNLNATILQYANIINTYCDATKYEKQLANILTEKIEIIFEDILELLSFEDPILRFKDEAIIANQSDICRLGSAFIRYGTLFSRPEITGTGRLLITSSLKTSPISESLIFADLYPVLIQNEFYPHFEVLSKKPSNITIWTCSPEVKLNSPSVGVLELLMKFPVGDSHYMIVTGLRAFNSIEMYGLKYRSDKQFERYDSPGYIYDFESQTLLLKMRHKNEIEKVVLTYSSQAASAAGANGQGNLLLSE